MVLEDHHRSAPREEARGTVNTSSSLADLGASADLVFPIFSGLYYSRIYPGVERSRKPPSPEDTTRRPGQPRVENLVWPLHTTSYCFSATLAPGMFLTFHSPFEFSLIRFPGP